LEYFKDKVADRDNAGAVSGSAQTSALGTMEHQVQGHWRVVWKKPLLNEVAPVGVLVYEHGQAITLDDWHGMGYGTNAVVFYDANGKVVRALSLADFLPKEYIDALPHSVSSIRWRGKPAISNDGAQLEIPVVEPRPHQGWRAEDMQHVVVRFDLATGDRIQGESQAWGDAVRSAHEANQERIAQEAAAKVRFISPLAPPDSADDRDWHSYLIEAYFRLDPDWNGGFPATKVVRLPNDPGYEKSVAWVREALTDELHATGVTMFASPSQDSLVDALSVEASKIGKGARSGARLYVVADSAHFASVRAALEHTGATVVQIDPAIPIPQRKERIERYLGQDPTDK